MKTPSAIALSDRGIIELSGPDKANFLQGLVSNDVRDVSEISCVYQTFLTAQGKFQHDFFMIASGESFLLDVDVTRKDDLFRRLRMYKLRSDVALQDQSAQWAIYAVIGDGAAQALGLSESAGAATPLESGGLAMVDPRHAAMGVRLLLPADAAPQIIAALGLEQGDVADYERQRLALGIPKAGVDLIPEKSTLLECNIDDLNGIAWDKGCYMGQELTARTKFRGLTKKRLMTVTFDGAAPEPGTQITLDGKDAGDMRSAAGGVGLALVKLDKAAAAEAGQGKLMAGDTALSVSLPSYAQFELPAAAG